jgi:hypothetical protein
LDIDEKEDDDNLASDTGEDTDTEEIIEPEAISIFGGWRLSFLDNECT